MSCFRRSEKSIFLLLKSIDKLAKNIFIKLQRSILSILEDTKPKAEKERRRREKGTEEKKEEKQGREENRREEFKKAEGPGKAD